MALLTLKDIGKIYVSEGNVTVGIRGVNLSFERGEFVAVTGKSGSGKSTLLNVISGMDSYEEGELTIEGQSTSHFLQPDWEEYREKYISFIFQDYNIIESFTVLQNVELALMNIEDKKERRARALELIERVGLTSHKNHKGSKLSGGQKQRTVIARALAKDSPIILADEPTGNLDSVTSDEIVKLLYEVSRDKLLIVVTHSFDEFQEYATRHIRIFDGAIESDHVIKAITDNAPTDATVKTATYKAKDKKAIIKRQIRDGITLGKSIFTAKPRLSLFLCLLMIVGTLGLFLSTSLCGGAGDIFKPNYMFNHIDGRLVLAKQNGAVIGEDELKLLAEKHGAEGYLHYDCLLDESYGNEISIYSEAKEDYRTFTAYSTYGKNFGSDIIGRYPKTEGEVFLYLPIYYQPTVGKDALLVTEMFMDGVEYDIVGVKYYFDNNLVPECLFTEEGFRTATAIHFLVGGNWSASTTVSVTDASGAVVKSFVLNGIMPNFDMPADKAHIFSKDYSDFIEDIGDGYTATVNYMSIYYNYDFFFDDSENSYVFEKSFSSADLTDVKPDINEQNPYVYDYYLIASDEIMREVAESVMEKSYVQASLFFENDRAAHSAAEKINNEGYIAVPSDTTYEPDALSTFMMILGSVLLAVVWVLSIFFLAFFITLCATRALDAFRADMAIMRSMGISVSVIRIGMYVRMLLSLIPAVVFVAVSAILIFTVPQFNEYFFYLYPWQYALIFVGMLALTVRVTYKQIARLFGESVKKSLKGGVRE